MKRVAITTFGCKVNQYESACIIEDFEKEGYVQVPFNEEADVYIVNSCTVTNRTDFKVRNAIRKALEQKKKNRDVKIAVTGCYAQLNRERIYKMGEVDVVVDNNHKDSIVDFLYKTETPLFVEDTSSFETFTEQNTANLLDRARAFIKIQDGCDYFCTYCTISYARGKPRSRKLEEVLKQVEVFLEKGYQEIVLTGVNLGLYGRDFAIDENLLCVLQELERYDKLKRVRLSSLEPQLINDELIDFFVQSEKICPHFHIPMQSGSDSVLKAMNRPYDTADFAGLINKLVKGIPNVAIGTDIILGFPTENDSLFQETIEFVESLPLVYAHIFPFSSRPGTQGALLKNNTPSNVVKERCSTIKHIFDSKKEKYIDALVENNVQISGIIESKNGKYWTALSDHYIRLFCKNEELEIGELFTGVVKNRLFDGVEVTV
ncbi:MAG: tRNA (N(6)-L-threonylcarbamoyladenosine(37)-C(2))-methylthiotransferase MtaB [Candidatus Cloacimonas sp.]|nr:tRNA (N(6)-L-threonylcarbamoyladenosine(37)-C(2))-methylthiotransferase MtaB [Candidatus Cloacimonadota bacterium]